MQDNEIVKKATASSTNYKNPCKKIKLPQDEKKENSPVK